MASKDKSSKSMQDIFKEVKQLDMRVLTINKEKDAQLYKRSPLLYNDLSEMDNKLGFEYSDDRIKTKKEIQQLRSMVTRFHGELKNVQPTPHFLERVKTIMEEIESSITLFKESQKEKYEQLMSSEVQYSHEVNALEKRFESWAETDQRVPAIKNPVSKLSSARDVIKNLPPEVAQFSKFLEETGGMRGGWDEYDQNTFLKWRVRYKGKHQFLAEAISHLPTKTAEEVTSHETWYREFLNLQEQKRLAIKAWKQRKDEKKNEAVEELSDSDDEAARLTDRQRVITERERQQRQQKLGTWRLEKELERAEAEEQRLREEREKLQKEHEDRLRQQEIRDKVADYKRHKREEEEFVKLENEEREFQDMEERREKLLLHKQRIQLRNDYALEQKTKHLRDTERKKQERLKREEKLKSQYEVSVTRDPSRLLRPTEGWKSRTKEVGASAESGRVYSMSHKSVPSWRRGL